MKGPGHDCLAFLAQLDRRRIHFSFPMGLKVVELRPIDGFAAETAAATIIEVASRLGIPVSTTHLISSSILGVGATKRASAVRWGVAGRILSAWVITIPVCVTLGWLCFQALELIPGV